MRMLDRGRPIARAAALLAMLAGLPLAASAQTATSPQTAAPPQPAAAAPAQTAAPLPAATDTRANDGTHLGVASCAGNNCHGAVEPVKGARVQQNEYLIWKQKDKHARAYAALTNDVGKRIAHNLGLPNDDAEHAPICLNCHADNAARRGPQFQISDGVGCEACHGGASGWLGVHISGADHKTNLAAGLYPTDQPLARAERCDLCHIVNAKRFINHDIMGAGHPPLYFELDTYTAIQPAHFTVTDNYVARKGRPNDVQIWAVGQAVDLRDRMDALLEPKNTPKGIQPELGLFDCQTCHHAMSQLQWRAGGSTGVGPGQMRLQDASAVMLRTIASRVAPNAAAALDSHMLALHEALHKGWPEVQQEARAMRQAADTLVPALTQHQFDKGDARALAEAVIAAGLGGDNLDYSGAQQQTMALESIVAGMKSMGFADDAQIKGLNDALGGLYTAVADDQKYRPEEFTQALRQVQAKLPP